jgi:Lipid A core - O-antigen ligase and related enzymes
LFLTFLALSNKSRFIELTNFKQGSAAVRLDLWQNGIKAFTKKPILGYGLENQGEAYVGYYKVDDALFARPNSYSDRAHNLILDILLTSGIVGLLVFAYFIYWVFINLIKTLKDEKYRHLATFLIWALTVYLVSLLFNFSVTVTNIYFWFIVAVSFVVTGKSLLVLKTETKNYDLAQIILITGVAILFLYGSLVEIKRLEADYYFKESLSNIAKSEYFMALVFNDYLDSTHPDQITLDYYNQALSLNFLERRPSINNRPSILVINNYLITVEKTLSNKNFENKFVKAFILGFEGKRYDSENLFNSLMTLSPQLPKLYLARGDVQMFNHDYKNAIINFEKADSLLPDSNSAYLGVMQKNNLISYKQQIDAHLIYVKSLSK